jgi:ABC-type phosphate transport system substrate-binding protein
MNYTAVIIVAALLGGIVQVDAAAGELRIGSAGTTLGVMRELGTAYEKVSRGTTIIVDRTSKASVGGARALLAGELQVATATRELSEADLDGYSKLQSVELARVPFVFAVNAATKVKGVTSGELLQIYQRKKTAWEDGSRIILIPRTPQVSDTLFLIELGPEWRKAMMALEEDPTMQKIDKAQDAANLVERRVGALTTSTLGLMRTENRAGMRALLVDGVEPVSPTYRYYKPVFILTLKDAPSEVRRFVEFLCSRSADKILASAGYIVAGSRTRCAAR